MLLIRLKSYCWSAAVALVAASLAFGEPEVAGGTERYRIGEQALRSQVLKAVPPAIPANYRPRSPTLAVAEVELSSDGTLVAVEILEAPSTALAHALIDALKSWKFSSFGGGRARYVGRLTFYFVSSGRSTRALSPAEMQETALKFAPPD